MSAGTSVMRNAMHIPALVAGLIVALCLSCVLATPAQADVQAGDLVLGHTAEEWGVDSSAMPDVDAVGAILISEDGTVLWERNADSQLGMASTTKIMTCLLALENTADLDAPITIPPEATLVGESSCYLEPGTTTTMRQLLTGMMLKSGNDAATAVAIIVGGSTENFVAMMNAKAEELGMTNTHFENVHGLDTDGHYSSPRDMATLSIYAMDVPGFEEIVSQPTATVDVGYGPTTFENGNRLLNYMPDCIGIKTGTEDRSGFCLVSAVRRGDTELYCVILGSSTDESRFQTSQSLYEWGFSSISYQTLGNTDSVVASVPNTAYLDRSVDLVCESPQDVVMFRQAGYVYQDVTIENACGEVTAGEQFGTLTWRQGPLVLAQTPLVATEDMKGPDLPTWLASYLRVTLSGDQVSTTQHVYLDSIMVHDRAATDQDRANAMGATTANAVGTLTGTAA